MGEIYESPDGQLYEWVESVDGLGNPIGFWKKIKRGIKKVAKAVYKAAKSPVTAAGLVLGPAIPATYWAARTLTRIGLPDPIKPLFDLVVASNIAKARRIHVPQSFKDKLLAYARHNKVDGALLMSGYLRQPAFYRGGWILNVNHPDAMTLDRHVFVKRRFTPQLYVHEMVHVGQYTSMGISASLSTYFGSIPITMLTRWLRGKSQIEEKKRSILETHAYAVQRRFREWCGARFSDCDQEHREGSIT